MTEDSDDSYLARHVEPSAADLGQRIDELLEHALPGGSPNLGLYREMLVTVVRMAQTNPARWDAKIMAQTLKELEQAFRTLERFRRRRKVTVFGSARTRLDHALYGLARELGSALAKRDMMVITGGGAGIMGAAHEGAGRDASLGFNITLPFEQRANPTIEGSDHLLSFHFFYVRKLFFLKEADALVLCPGGFGTLDETFEVLTLIQTGKSPLVPLVLLDTPDGHFWDDALAYLERNLLDEGYILPADLKLVRLVRSAEAAAAEIERFYGNYHSTRWRDRRFYIRLKHPLTPACLELLATDFADLCRTPGFTQLGVGEGEPDEAEFAHLTRLTFDFHGRHYGRLRELVDELNRPEFWAST